LEKESIKSSSPIPAVVSNKYSVRGRATVHKSPYERYENIKQNAPAPTLAELEAKGQYQRKMELRDLNQVATSDHDDEDKKRELILKFDLLKQSYPKSATIVPEYTIHSDLIEMRKTYDITLKKLSLDSSIEWYRKILIFGFGIMEYVLGNYLGLDMSGFTKQQVVSMDSYDRLLIELGEKSYVPGGSRYPVELRLVGLALFNACSFLFMKMMMRATGENISGLFSQKVAEQSTKPKRRMKGPNVDLNNLPDVSSGSHEPQGTHAYPQGTHAYPQEIPNHQT